MKSLTKYVLFKVLSFSRSLRNHKFSQIQPKKTVLKDCENKWGFKGGGDIFKIIYTPVEIISIYKATNLKHNSVLLYLKLDKPGDKRPFHPVKKES